MNLGSVESFRRRLRRQPVYGLFAKTRDPAWIEAAGRAGFDFVIPDMEHGPAGLETVQDLVRAAEGSGMLPIVRVREADPSLIGAVLDLGAAGVQVPQVESREQAEAAVRRARFAPEGARGVCRFVRAAEYSALDRFEYFRSANRAILVLQAEGREALEGIEEILRTPGLDVLFIGPYDLSQSLGLPGRVDHPQVERRVREIARACARRGVAAGTFVDSAAAAGKWVRAGVRYIGCGVDAGLFYDACRAQVEALRAAGAPPRKRARARTGRPAQ